MYMEMKYRNVMVNATFNKRKRFFYQQTGSTFKVEIIKLLHLEHILIWCWIMNTSESKTEIPWKFRNVGLVKGGEDQLDRSCVKWRSAAKRHGGKANLLRAKRTKAYWIGHILCRNSLIQHISEGRIEGRLEVTRRRERRHHQLLDIVSKWDAIINWKRKIRVWNLVAHNEGGN
jgi:hypothetical protein